MDGMPDFANIPGGITADSLAEAQKQQDSQEVIAPQMDQVAMPTPPPVQEINVSDMMDFVNNHRGGTPARPMPSANPMMGGSAMPPQPGRANPLVHQFLSGFGDNQPSSVPTAPQTPTQSQGLVQESSIDKSVNGSMKGCVCTSACPNKDCVFYGSENYMSINDIVDDLVEARIDHLKRSGELKKKKTAIKKTKLKKNRYLQDVVDKLV